MEGLVPLIIDSLILVCLVITIFFASRLSIHLKVFRESRSALEGLLGEISGHIEQAEHAMLNLKTTSKEIGRDLQSAMDEAVHLRDELSLMNDTGNNLAGRLERAAENKQKDVVSRTATGAKAEDVLFSIQDREFEEDEYDAGADDWMEPYDDEMESDGFNSESERELYEALQSKRHSQKKSESA